MSTRLLKEELRSGTLAVLKVPGWPLRRRIQLVRLTEAYSFRAVQQLIDVATRELPEMRPVKQVISRQVDD